MLADQTATTVNLFPTLLQVVPRLGRSEEDFMSVRNFDDVRQAIAARMIGPTIQFHTLTVDYDDPAFRLVNPSQFVTIHRALTGRSMPVRRTGCHDLTMVEIFANYPLSTNEQLELLTALGYTTPCWAEVLTGLNTCLRKAKRRLMAHLGPLFDLREGDPAITTIIQTDSAERVLDASRLYDRWSQEQYLLGVKLH